MTLLAGPNWPVRFALQRQFDMAVPAQTMKHRLHFGRDGLVGFVAVVAEALAGGIDEIMVAGDAVVGGVVGVCEGHRQQRCERLLVLVFGCAIDRCQCGDAQ